VASRIYIENIPNEYLRVPGTISSNLWTLVSQPRNANLISLSLFFVTLVLMAFRLREFSKRNVYQAIMITSLMLALFGPVSTDHFRRLINQLILQITLGLLYPTQLFLLALISIVSPLEFLQGSSRVD
jgi:hypothetical protein